MNTVASQPHHITHPYARDWILGYFGTKIWLDEFEFKPLILNWKISDFLTGGESGIRTEPLTH